MNELGMSSDRPRPRMRRHAAQAPAELYEQYMADVDAHDAEQTDRHAVAQTDSASVPVARPDMADRVETDEGDDFVDDLDYERGEFESAYDAEVVVIGAHASHPPVAELDDLDDLDDLDEVDQDEDDQDEDDQVDQDAADVAVAASVRIPVQAAAADAGDGWVDDDDEAAATSRRGAWTKVQFGLAALSATPLLFLGGLGGWPWEHDKAAVANEASTTPGNYPVSVQLARLDISAPTDALGVDPLTKVLQPPAIGRAGWYEAGPEPGELGRAVMLGRRSPEGVDVFAKLDQARAGDKIVVKTVDGSVRTFVVTKIETFAADEVPIDRIYGGTQQRAQLRMISSAGQFVANKGGYQRNVVVFANLAN